MLLACTSCRKEWKVGALKEGVKIQCPACGSPMRPVSTPGVPYLLVQGGEGQRFELHGATVVGSAESAEVVLRDPSVAGFHARLTPAESGSWLLEDLQSAGLTRVNSQPVTRRKLIDGDWLQFGGVSLTFVAGARPAVSLSVLDGPAESGEGLRVLEPETRAGATPPARLAQVHEQAAALLTLSGEATLCERLCAAAGELFAPSRAAVMFLDGPIPAQGPLPLRLGAGWRREGSGESGEIRLSCSLVRRILQAGRPVLVADVLTDPEFRPTGSVLRAGTRSVLAAPLACRGETLGVLYADRTDVADPFPEDDLLLFGALASVGAAALAADRFATQLARESLVRSHLARYLAPELVEEAVSGRLSWQPGGEQKEVTVLFSDVRGFTAASEHLSPQEVVATLNDYFALMVEEIFKERGTLDKFVGDAIMAVWGSPLGHETDPLSAVRAAIGMQRALKAFNARQAAAGRPPVAMGVGINTGSAVAGNIGSPRRMDFTVIGDTVNLASRIESQTGPGQIFIGEATFARIKGQMPVRPVGPIAVKGRQQSAYIYELTYDAGGNGAGPAKPGGPRRVYCRAAEQTAAWAAILSEFTNEQFTVVARVEQAVGDQLYLAIGESEPGSACQVTARFAGTDSKGRKVQVLTLKARSPTEGAALARRLAGA